MTLDVRVERGSPARLSVCDRRFKFVCAPMLHSVCGVHSCAWAVASSLRVACENSDVCKYNTVDAGAAESGESAC